jgi:hypothetical protein
MTDEHPSADDPVEFRLNENTGVLLGSRRTEWIEADTVVVLADWL